VRRVVRPHLSCEWWPESYAKGCSNGI
jgi:hypothetical protein